MQTCETLTPAQWRAIHADYKTIIDGQRYVLRYEGGYGTCLVPVEVR